MCCALKLVGGVYQKNVWCQSLMVILCYQLWCNGKIAPTPTMKSSVCCALKKKNQAMTLREEEGSHFNVTVTLSVQNFIWRYSLTCMAHAC